MLYLCKLHNEFNYIYLFGKGNGKLQVDYAAVNSYFRYFMLEVVPNSWQILAFKVIPGALLTIWLVIWMFKDYSSWEIGENGIYTSRHAICIIHVQRKQQIALLCCCRQCTFLCDINSQKVNVADASSAIQINMTSCCG